jgi:hypothetical protein
MSTIRPRGSKAGKASAAGRRTTRTPLATRAQIAALGRETLGALPPDSPHLGIGGAVGDALFACALKRADPDVNAARWISRAFDAYDTHGADASLHHGLAGLGFLVVTCTDAHDALPDIDESLTAALPDIPTKGLQGGIAGIALYASLRSEAPSGRRLQDAVIDALAKGATPSDGGVVWHTPSSYARARGVEVLGEPITEFGMTHGISGVLFALAALAAQGRRDAAELARAGLRALWAWERSPPTRFGRIEFGPNGAAGSVELPPAFCVGDTGTLRAAWLAANAIGDTVSAGRALARLREGATNDRAGDLPGVPGRFDLCCGAGAIGHIYRRMYLDTELEEFRAASERILAACAREVGNVPKLTFGYGRMGVILALLGAVTKDEPGWDAILGMSLPARHE